MPVATPEQIANQPNFTLGDLWALAEQHAAAAGGVAYAEGQSDYAADKFVLREAAGKDWMRLDFKAERFRESPESPVERSMYYLRQETGTVIDLAQVDPRLVAAVVDYLSAIDQLDEVEGDTALRVEHSCSVLDSRMDFEFHTMYHYNVYGYSVYFDGDGDAILGSENRHDEQDDDGIGVDTDVLDELSADQLAEVEILSFGDEADSMLAELDSVFEDTRVAEGVLQSRDLYVSLMSRGAIRKQSAEDSDD